MKTRCVTMARSPKISSNWRIGSSSVASPPWQWRPPAFIGYRCFKKSEAEIAKALRGDWRKEHLFTLRQSLEAWRFHQNLMADCDLQIASRRDAIEDREAGSPPVTGRKKGSKSHEEPMREPLYEKFGVDLTAVEGVSIQTCLAFLSEVGTDVEKFPSAEHFASWMGLCPDNRITGGRTNAAHTRKVQNRLANALRMAAQSLHRSKAGLGDWFRRLKAKLGTKAAVTAAAHKLARILWAMVKHRRPLRPRASLQSRAGARTQRVLSSPTGRATRLHLDPGPRGSFIRVRSSTPIQKSTFPQKRKLPNHRSNPTIFPCFRCISSATG